MEENKTIEQSPAELAERENEEVEDNERGSAEPEATTEEKSDEAVEVPAE